MGANSAAVAAGDAVGAGETGCLSQPSVYFGPVPAPGSGIAASDEVRSSFLESPLAVGLARGTRLGEYEVQSLLGTGGMGEVYRARDLRLRREVAIKVLAAFVSSDPERLRRFEQEAMADAALNHPNILAVYQMGTHEGAHYLASELLEGETLRKQLKHGCIALRQRTPPSLLQTSISSGGLPDSAAGAGPRRSHQRSRAIRRECGWHCPGCRLVR